MLVKDAVDASLTHLKASVAWAQNAPFSLATLEALLAGTVTAFDARTGWAFSIFDHAATRVLGAVAIEPGAHSLRALVGEDVVEIGYWLRADATGKGYATEATGALVELAFTRLGARHVAICHDPDNVASAGVPRRLGFRDFGTVTSEILPGRQAADGCIRRATKVWVLEAQRGGRREDAPRMSVY